MVPSFRKAISQGDSACWKLSALTVTAETELTYIIDDAASSVKAPIFDETEIPIVNRLRKLILRENEFEFSHQKIKHENRKQF
jgi:hypothetical protein